VATTQSAGNNTTAIATTAFVQAAIALLYPVGSIYTNATSSTNAGTLLGFGTWTAFGAGRVPVGFDSGNALFDSAEETGGSADAITVSHTHTATTTSTDSGHTHGISPGAWTDGGGKVEGNSFSFGGKVTATQSSTANISSSTTVASTGSSGTNANYQPYITVYMWKRTA
jgi:microcystin-dependent protein